MDSYRKYGNKFRSACKIVRLYVMKPDPSYKMARGSKKAILLQLRGFAIFLYIAPLTQHETSWKLLNFWVWIGTIQSVVDIPYQFLHYSIGRKRKEKEQEEQAQATAAADATSSSSATRGLSIQQPRSGSTAATLTTPTAAATTITVDTDDTDNTTDSQDPVIIEVCVC